jgi:hypothetical protein
MDADKPDSAGFWHGLWQGPLALYRIRFGTGVLGRLTTNLIAILSVFGAAGIISLLAGYPGIAVGCLACCAMSYLINHASTMIFAHWNPTAALLEGADFVRVREIEMASKDLPSLGSHPNIAAPVIEATRADADTVQLAHQVGENPDESPHR